MRPLPAVTRVSLSTVCCCVSATLARAPSASFGSFRLKSTVVTSPASVTPSGPPRRIGRSSATNAFRSRFATFRSKRPLPPVSVPPPVTLPSRISFSARPSIRCACASRCTVACASITGRRWSPSVPGFALTIDTGPVTAKPFAGAEPAGALTGASSARTARSAAGAPGDNACGFTWSNASDARVSGTVPNGAASTCARPFSFIPLASTSATSASSEPDTRARASTGSSDSLPA